MTPPARIWLDNHLSPRLAKWISDQFQIEAVQVRDLGLATSDDIRIFEAARATGSIIMTKDRDFAGLVTRFGAPPAIIWLTCGNTSTAALKKVLEAKLPAALRFIAEAEPLVEIADLGHG